MFYDDLITKDPYGIVNACRPENSLDAQRPPVKVSTRDPQWQVDNCLTCPGDGEDCSEECRFRLGLQETTAEEEQAKPPKQPQTPCGRPSQYDPVIIANCVGAGMRIQAISRRLGVTTDRAYKYIARWRRENED